MIPPCFGVSLVAMSETRLSVLVGGEEDLFFCIYIYGNIGNLTNHIVWFYVTIPYHIYTYI